MALATITSKGQITIPKQIREALQLRTGDKIEITVTGRGKALMRPVTRKVDDVFGKLHVPGKKSVSVESMNQAIRKKMRSGT